MARPRLRRRIQFKPRITAFKPEGRFFNITELTMEELEALRLKNVQGFDQIDAAKRMRTSQSTFQRILSSAYKKLGHAIIYGERLKIKEES